MVNECVDKIQLIPLFGGYRENYKTTHGFLKLRENVCTVFNAILIVAVFAELPSVICRNRQVYINANAAKPANIQPLTIYCTYFVQVLRHVCALYLLAHYQIQPVHCKPGIQYMQAEPSKAWLVTMLLPRVMLL